MLHYIEQALTSFVASAAFGIIFNAPRRMLIHGGFVGMVGWIIYVVLEYATNAVPATLIATIALGAISQLFSRMFRAPVIIFSVAGIIPLVPGGLAYNAMRSFVQNDYSAAIEMAAKALMLSGSIAVGLVLSEVLNQIVRNLSHVARVKPASK
ncbi:MAG: threonine/serine exporter family protein [Paenibacillus sp.]|uniref:threonine/serine exporter family protein n=1 Tax=Paenibacillus sp. TaxID=58172 RepID=UPI0025CBA8A7|nr:threonine/serine exporter family protein [Paenibacillus sp.]MBR2566976.1 threonine/serine exporter family protein [Paenibacillus sp.]